MYVCVYMRSSIGDILTWHRFVVEDEVVVVAGVVVAVVQRVEAVDAIRPAGLLGLNTNIQCRLVKSHWHQEHHVPIKLFFGL